MDSNVKDVLDRAWADFRKWTDVYPDWEDDRRNEPAPGTEPLEHAGEYRLPRAMLDDFESYFVWRQALEPDMAGQISCFSDGEPWAAQAVWELANEGLLLPNAYDAYSEWVTAHGAKPVPFGDVEKEL